MTINDIYCSCENIKRLCAFQVYDDLDCYCGHGVQGLIYSDTFAALPYAVSHESEVIMFKISSNAWNVDVLIDLEVK